MRNSSPDPTELRPVRGQSPARLLCRPSLVLQDAPDRTFGSTRRAAEPELDSGGRSAPFSDDRVPFFAALLADIQSRGLREHATGTREGGFGCTINGNRYVPRRRY